MRKILFTFIVILQFHSINVFAQNEKTFPQPQIEYNPNKYICYRADDFIKVDGKLSEPVWADAPWTEYFIDIEGDTKPKPYYKTRAKMLWDDKYFYFAAEMEDPDLWASLRKRDAVIFYDNDFEVFIDPDGDTHKYYELEVNQFGTEWDLLLLKPYRDDGSVASNSWDIQGLKTAVDLLGTINNPKDTDIGWVIEIAIPWKVLKEFSQGTPPKENDQWKVNFSRVQWPMEIDNGRYKKEKHPETKKNFPENNWVWSPQGIIAMHYPEMWGTVQFSFKVAGTGEDEFVKSELDIAKWELRKLYYQQKTFYMNNGYYTDDVDELNLNEAKLEDYSWPPEVHATPNLFEASIIDNEGNKLTIYNDGLIKVYNKEK